jgi:nucleoside-diphosphate-sugar epimerase
MEGISALNETNSGFRKALINVPPKETATGYVGNWVDVRDVAVAHSRALSVNEAAGQRFLISAGPFSWQDICAFLCISSMHADLTENRSLCTLQMMLCVRLEFRIFLEVTQVLKTARLITLKLETKPYMSLVLDIQL